MSNVKFKYVREDMSNKSRVITVAYTENEDKTVSVGYAVNQPERWHKYSDKNHISLARQPGDTFSKKKGRMIAVGRLRNSTIISQVLPGQKPLIVALQAVRNDTTVRDVKDLIDLEIDYQQQLEDHARVNSSYTEYRLARSAHEEVRVRL